MTRERIADLVTRHARGERSLDDTVHDLVMEPFVEAGDTKFDLQRLARRGLPEVVYCEGKGPDQVATIFSTIAGLGHAVLGTRADARHADAVADVLAEATFDPVSRLLRWTPGDAPPLEEDGPFVAVVSAGAADRQVHAEAVGCLQAFGIATTAITDAGVAGLQRILAYVPTLNEATVVVVVAGMDGALPSVVGGLTSSPVIAVPTSVGYGASFGGLSALLAMLNSCAGGVTVTNVDAGFTAAYAAASMVAKVRQAADRGGSR